MTFEIEPTLCLTAREIELIVPAFKRPLESADGVFPEWAAVVKKVQAFMLWDQNSTYGPAERADDV